MHSRITHFAIAGLAAVVAILSGCSDDADPVAPGPAEVALATYFTIVSAAGPTEPAEASVTVEFGVESDPPDPTTIYPEPLFFGSREMSNGVTANYRALNTPQFAILADRLTDGIDEPAFARLTLSNGAIGSAGNSESNFFDFTPGLVFTGPDLFGYTVTRITVTTDPITLTEAGGFWNLEVNLLLTIYGYEE